MKKYLKIFLLLGAAYIISYFSIKNIFLAESPRINPFFAQNMMAKVNNFWSKTTNFIAFKSARNNGLNNQSNKPSTINNSNNFNFQNQAKTPTVIPVVVQRNNLPQDVLDALQAPLTKVSQGVYAGEKNDIKVIEIRTDEIDYLEYTFTVNGKEIKIKVPKGIEPPSQGVVESLYR